MDDDLARLAAAAPAARRRPAGAPASPSHTAGFVLATVAALAVLCVLGWLGTRKPVVIDHTRDVPTLRAGSAAVIANGGPVGQPIGLAVTEADHERLLQLSVAKDVVGVSQLVAAGRVLLVRQGTGCRVISPGLLKHEVRVTDGDQAGKSGFVDAEFLKAAP